MYDIEKEHILRMVDLQNRQGKDCRSRRSTELQARAEPVAEATEAAERNGLRRRQSDEADGMILTEKSWLTCRAIRVRWCSL